MTVNPGELKRVRARGSKVRSVLRVTHGDRWVGLQDGALLEDGTRGLINSGIVRLALRPVAPCAN